MAAKTQARRNGNGNGKTRKPKTDLAAAMTRALKVIDQCDELALPEPMHLGMSQDRPGAIFAELDHMGLLMWVTRADSFKIVEPRRLSDGSWPRTGNVAIEMSRGDVDWFIRTPRYVDGPPALPAGTS